MRWNCTLGGAGRAVFFRQLIFCSIRTGLNNNILTNDDIMSNPPGIARVLAVAVAAAAVLGPSFTSRAVIQTERSNFKVDNFACRDANLSSS